MLLDNFKKCDIILKYGSGSNYLSGQVVSIEIKKNLLISKQILNNIKFILAIDTTLFNIDLKIPYDIDIITDIGEYRIPLCHLFKDKNGPYFTTNHIPMKHDKPTALFIEEI